MPQSTSVQIVATVSLTFLAYLMIGLPLAVLPSFVNDRLGLGSVLAGLVVSAQYLATFANRAQAGRMADRTGPKRTVVLGLAVGGASGLFLLLASALAHAPIWSFAALLVSRVCLGFGESWVGTGTIMWAIGRVGARRTSTIISWNGVASYGAIALGAPLGVALNQAFGLWSIGAAVLGLGVLGLLLAWPKAPVAVVAGEQLAFRVVFWRVLPHGVALALGTSGFGVIATFVTLYYAANDWSGAAFALSVFGLCFVATRLVAASAIPRFGPLPAALVSLVVETAGLLTMWSAAGPLAALAGAALTGAGFSLVFPAIGVEAVALVPAPNRGAALGAYSVFFDIALGLAGPVAGAIAARHGYAATFLFAGFCTTAGALITLSLHWRARRQNQSVDSR